MTIAIESTSDMPKVLESWFTKVTPDDNNATPTPVTSNGNPNLVVLTLAVSCISSVNIIPLPSLFSDPDCSRHAR